MGEKPQDPGSDVITRTGQTAELDSSAELPRAPVLTLLYHPDLSRVGERAVLSDLPLGTPVEVSRLGPELSTPEGEASGPLADPFVSRKPLVLEAKADQGLVLTTDRTSQEIVVDGEEVDYSLFLPARKLRAGVVIEVAGRVVLLLREDAPEARARRGFGLIGTSTALERARGAVSRVASLEIPVLVTGESGTGKELVARAIHTSSKRRDGPWVSVNMASLQGETAVSQLFGHVRGAFTGADREHDGFFARAHKGTLFLDEISATPTPIQPMLLRALESGEVCPVGSASTSHVDVRVVTAADKLLPEEVEAGRFVGPLLHRLAGYEIRIPPLRERPEDAAAILAEVLRTELVAHGREDLLDAGEDGRTMWLSARLVSRMLRYDWPGNVRQLRNVTRAVVLEGLDSPGACDELLDRLLAGSGSLPERPGEAPAAGAEGGGDDPDAHQRQASEISDEQIVSALRSNGFRRERAAASLGISRTTLYERIRRSPVIRLMHEIGEEEIRRCEEEHGGDTEQMARALEVSERALRLRMKELGLK